MRLNGSASASSNEPVLLTDQSFTVDTWVWLDESGTERIVLVQRGPPGVDPLVLRYDGARWSAGMSSAPDDPVWSWATADAEVNKWTRLTATYDAAARKLSLYVDGQLKGTATGVAAWNSTGVLTVGRSSVGAPWLGGMDDLRIYQSVLPPTA